MFADLIEKAGQLQAQAGQELEQFTAPYADRNSQLLAARQGLEAERDSMPSVEWLRGAGRLAEANNNAARRRHIEQELARIAQESHANTLAFYQGKARLLSAWKGRISDLLGEARSREIEAQEAIKAERGQLVTIYNALADQEREAGNGAVGLQFSAMDMQARQSGLIRSY